MKRAVVRHGATPIVPAFVSTPPHTGPSCNDQVRAGMTGRAQDFELRAPSRPAADAAYMPLVEVLTRAAFVCLGAFQTPEAKSYVRHAQ